MSRLNWKEILQAYPHLLRLGEDEQVNVNHVGCEAGADKRQRLYVRNKDGKLLGFCHNCQSKGAHGSGPRRHIRKRVASMPQWTIRLPPDLTQVWSEFHPAARAWLNKYLTPSDCKRWHIGWSAELGRVVLPIYARNGALIAYQTRNVLPYDTGPKYLTERIRTVQHPMFLGTSKPGTKTVALTEDMLSAIVVSRECNTAALLGVYLSDANMYELLDMGYTRFVVLLDDDKPEVRTQQRRIAKRLSQFGEVKVVQGHTTDPKEWDTNQIREAIS